MFVSYHNIIQHEHKADDKEHSQYTSEGGLRDTGVRVYLIKYRLSLDILIICKSILSNTQLRYSLLLFPV